MTAARTPRELKKYQADELEEPKIRDLHNGLWEWTIVKKGGLRVASGNNKSFPKAQADAAEMLRKLTS